jgi:hypothetical protein
VIAPLSGGLKYRRSNAHSNPPYRFSNQTAALNAEIETLPNSFFEQ